MTQPTRHQQLQQLADRFSVLHKAILTKYGGPIAPMSPVLSKTVMIIGSEEQVNIKHIAALLMITSGAATQHVAALEETGMVKRAMGLQDRREIMVKLTPAGQKVYQEIQVRSRKILQEVFKDLTAKELTELLALMTKVSNTYRNEGKHDS
jgi:DNA-binding MarR family transcriptional regulator